MELGMIDINPDEPGQYFNFRNPLPYNQYYAVKPQYHPPLGAQPVVDDNTGLCIGYTFAQAPGLWQVYDSEGRFITLEETPLQTPLIDPVDKRPVGIRRFSPVAQRTGNTGCCCGKKSGCRTEWSNSEYTP